MSSSLTASRHGRAGIARRGVRDRVLRWPGWPACSSAARVAGVGFLILTIVLIGSGLMIVHLLGHSVGRWDDQVNAMFARNRTHFGTWITGYLTALANAPAIVALALAVSVVAVATRYARLAAILVIGLVVEVTTFLASNYAVARPRPHVRHLGTTPSTYSWPSGHVGATFVLYAWIALMVTVTTKRLLPRIVAWTLAAAVTASVGLSRVYRGEHHPTDVIAGLVLGVGALLTGILAVRAWAARAHPADQPREAPAPTGAGEEIAGAA